MSTSYTGNPILGQQQQEQQEQEQRRQELLDLQARISAELASYPSPPVAFSQPTPFTDQPSTQCQQHPRHEFSRSLSMAGSIGRTTFLGRNHVGSLEMSRSVSQHSGPAAMARTKSMGAPPSSMLRSFSNNGHTASGPQPTGGHPNSAVIDAWQSQQDVPYTYQPYRQSSQIQPELAQVPELDVGEDPSTYFSRRRTPFLSVTTVDFPANSFMNNPAQARFSHSRRSTFSNPTPNTPSSTTLTTDNTLASEMSRQSSTCDDALQSFQMMNVHSNTSEISSADGTMYSGSTQFYPQASLKQVSSNEEQNLLLAGAGGASYGQQVLFPLFASQKVSSNQPSTSIRHVARMQRTESIDSNVSSSSAKSRSRQQLQKQNQLATNRKLAPKGGSDDDESKNVSPLVRIKSKDGYEDKLVAAIAKAPYQRPKHDRLFCDICDDREGFRGAHELGRHHDRQHKDMVKKWVCVEPADGIKEEFRPINSLAKCKACSQQNKKYGAYYNAAAHLRRAHFVPKPRGRNKSGKAEDKSEKRGGKGGGDWPPMKELKRWMKDVYESRDTVQQDDEEDSGDDKVLGDFEEESTMAAASNPIAFDQSFLYPTADAPMFDYTSSGDSSFVTQNVHMSGMMETSFHMPQHDLDQSMLMAPSQQSNDSFDSTMLMTDELNFIDGHQTHPFATTNTLLPQHNFVESDLGSDMFFSYDATM